MFGPALKEICYSDFDLLDWSNAFNPFPNVKV